MPPRTQYFPVPRISQTDDERNARACPRVLKIPKSHKNLEKRDPYFLSAAGYISKVLGRFCKSPQSKKGGGGGKNILYPSHSTGYDQRTFLKIYFWLKILVFLQLKLLSTLQESVGFYTEGIFALYKLGRIQCDLNFTNNAIEMNLAFLYKNDHF